MTVTDDFASSSATEMAAGIRRRDISPVELMDAVIQRIETFNPSLNEFVHTDFDEARERARQASGQGTQWPRDRPSTRCTVSPTAVVDLLDFEPGWPATLGDIPALKNSSSLHAAPTQSGWRRAAPSSPARPTAPS
jgi:amidase/aspartyl-tRNA(Asn)/glutamyl-tRNA(Gln) amidotransferase subunit A